MADTTQLRGIARELRRLQQSSPTRRDDLDDWYEDARRFTHWEHATFPDVRLPALVMFYLHDADLRLEDPEYRQSQDKALDELIASLERGVVPQSRGGSIAFHPRWLGAAALVVLAAIVYRAAS